MGIIYKNRKKYSGDRKIGDLSLGKLYRQTLTVTAGSSGMSYQEANFEIAKKVAKVMDDLPDGYCFIMHSFRGIAISQSTVWSTDGTSHAFLTQLEALSITDTNAGRTIYQYNSTDETKNFVCGESINISSGSTSRVLYKDQQCIAPNSSWSANLYFTLYKLDEVLPHE